MRVAGGVVQGGTGDEEVAAIVLYIEIYTP